MQHPVAVERLCGAKVVPVPARGDPPSAPSSATQAFWTSSSETDRESGEVMWPAEQSSWLCAGRVRQGSRKGKARFQVIINGNFGHNNLCYLTPIYTITDNFQLCDNAIFKFLNFCMWHNFAHDIVFCRIVEHTVADSALFEDWSVAYSKAKVHSMSECPVCLISLHPSRDPDHTHHQPRPIAVLSCGHLFHEKCIESLERHNYQGQGEIPLCPLCRTPYLRQIYQVQKPKLPNPS